MDGSLASLQRSVDARRSYRVIKCHSDRDSTDLARTFPELGIKSIARSARGKRVSERGSTSTESGVNDLMNGWASAGDRFERRSVTKGRLAHTDTDSTVTTIDGATTALREGTTSHSSVTYRPAPEGIPTQSVSDLGCDTSSVLTSAQPVSADGVRSISRAHGSLTTQENMMCRQITYPGNAGEYVKAKREKTVPHNRSGQPCPTTRSRTTSPGHKAVHHTTTNSTNSLLREVEQLVGITPGSISSRTTQYPARARGQGVHSYSADSFNANQDCSVIHETYNQDNMDVPDECSTDGIKSGRNGGDRRKKVCYGFSLGSLA